MPRTWLPACGLNRLEFVTETMRAALEALTVAAPDWLAGHDLVSEAWVKRYGAHADPTPGYLLQRGSPSDRDLRP
jgi:hypothetical protein